MTKANQKFFAELRKEINEDYTPNSYLDEVDVACAYFPGREPYGSMAYKEYVHLLEVCKEKDAYIAELEQQLRDNHNPPIDIKGQKNEARELVEQLIVYAENEDKRVAREIKIALNTKMANGYIASDVLTDEWKQRLEDLGRDKPRRSNAMNFNNQVGTVVGHADHVTLQYREDE